MLRAWTELRDEELRSQILCVISIVIEGEFLWLKKKGMKEAVC